MFVVNDNGTMNFGGHVSSAKGAFASHSYALPAGVFVVNDNATMTFGGNGSSANGAFNSYSQALPVGLFNVNGNVTMNFGGNGSSANGAFNSYSQAFPTGIFTSKDKVKMNFGGTNGGNGAFRDYSIAFIAGLFLAKDESVMSFGGQGGFGGAFSHMNAASAPTIVSNLFVATDSAVMSFGGYGTSGSGAFASRALIFQAGTFLVKGSAVMTFGAEQGTGAFRTTNAKFVAATFKGAENGTFDFGYFANATAITGGAFSGTPGTNSDIATTAAQLVDLTDNASLGNVAGTFYSTGITGALPEWWNLSPEPSPHDLCFYGNDSATNIDSVPADWK
jgi:hypothetical protein